MKPWIRCFVFELRGCSAKNKAFFDPGVGFVDKTLKNACAMELGISYM